MKKYVRSVSELSYNHCTDHLSLIRSEASGLTPRVTISALFVTISEVSCIDLKYYQFAEIIRLKVAEIYITLLSRKFILTEQLRKL